MAAVIRLDCGNGLALAPNTRSDVFSTEVSDTSPHPDSLRHCNRPTATEVLREHNSTGALQQLHCSSSALASLPVNDVDALASMTA